MKRGQWVGIAVCVLLGLWAGGFSAPIPGRWEKVDGLTSGRGIRVTMEGGERLEGGFVSSTPESLVIRDEDGEERALPKSGVKKVETIERTSRGRIWDGALLGAAIGAAATLITVAAVDSDSLEAGGVLMGTAIGAGIGLGCDAAVGAREVLYQQATRSQRAQAGNPQPSTQQASN